MSHLTVIRSSAPDGGSARAPGGPHDSSPRCVGRPWTGRTALQWEDRPPLHYTRWGRDRFDPERAAAGLQDVTPHDLRATPATWMADSHGVMAAAQRLGHSNASVTTRHYARAVAGRDREMADRLDAQARRAVAGGERARSGHGEDDAGTTVGAESALTCAFCALGAVAQPVRAADS